MDYMSPHNRSSAKGFTLVEVLLVSPLVILIIGVIVAFIVSITGNALINRERAAMVYDLQTGLQQIERDVQFSIAMEYTTGTTPIGQGGPPTYNGSAAFTSGSDTMVLRQYSTNLNPRDQARSLLYMRNQPNPCGTSQHYNTPLTHHVIYFLEGTDLKRRTILRFTSGSVCDVTGGPNSNDVWQANTCKTINRTICTSYDAIIATNVSSLQFSYFRQPSDTTSIGMTALNSRRINTVRVEITSTKEVAGSSVSQSAMIRASRVR